MRLKQKRHFSYACVCVNVQLRKRGAKISPKSQHERNKKTTIIPFQWVSRGKVIKTEPTPNLLAEKKRWQTKNDQLSLWGNGFYLVGPCDAESRLDVDAVTNCVCVCTLTSAVAATRYSLFTRHSSPQNSTIICRSWWGYCLRPVQAAASNAPKFGPSPREITRLYTVHGAEPN